MKILVVVGVGLALLALPALLKPKSSPPLVGPKLESLSYTEVVFENVANGLRLGGMLFVPEGAGPHPTAIIIHGSGTSQRESKWYLSVTGYLQRKGIAVLLPDKRGSEKSEGSWLGASLEDLANDTLAAIEFLQLQDGFSISSIGLIGMSQGGWIAPIVASKSDSLSFIVSMVGATVTPEEQLTHEETYNIEPFTYMFLARLIAPITAARLMRMDFFQPWSGFDPIPYWQAVEAPVFFAFGGNDRNVPVEASIERLRENGLDHHRIEVYPGGGHAVRDPETNEVSSEFLEDLSEFIAEASSGE
ncbi:alpha/beta hydrolase family protein [Candidatus Bipolaricaulota bacterium]